MPCLEGSKITLDRETSFTLMIQVTKPGVNHTKSGLIFVILLLQKLRIFNEIYIGQTKNVGKLALKLSWLSPYPTSQQYTVNLSPPKFFTQIGVEYSLPGLGMVWLVPSRRVQALPLKQDHHCMVYR